MKEDAITTFNRRLRILAMFKGREALTTPMVHQRLKGTAEEMDERSVQRALALLGEAGFLETVNPGTKPLQWRWPKARKHMTLPRLSDQEILAFRLLELFVKPLLPRESQQALRPYFDTARDELERMSFWAPVKNWERKVRVVPPAQPLLPPRPPAPLPSEAAREDWDRRQGQIRETVLAALFENRQCRIDYRQMWRDAPARWVVHPLLYLQRGPAFYLLCTIDEFADVRQLALHRVLAADKLDAKAHRPKGFDADREVGRCQGMGAAGSQSGWSPASGSGPACTFWKRRCRPTRKPTSRTPTTSGCAPPSRTPPNCAGGCCPSASRWRCWNRPPCARKWPATPAG